MITLVSLADLGPQLKDLRKAKGLFLEEVGAAIGLSGAQVSNIENGKSKGLQIDVLEKLAALYGVSLFFGLAANKHDVHRYLDYQAYSQTQH